MGSFLVRFHIFQESKTVGAISNKELEAGFIRAIKLGFKGTPIQFHIEGVTRTINKAWSRCEDELGYKSASRKGGPETLNVFVCDMANKKLMGGSTHLPPVVLANPNYDGVSIMNPSLGQQTFAHQALVHEVCLLKYLLYVCNPRFPNLSITVNFTFPYTCINVF